MDELSRITRLEERLLGLTEDVRDVEREVGIGPEGPGTATLRGRLHALETSEAAAKAAAAATELAREALQQKSSRKWSTRERIFALVLGAWVAILPTVNFVLQLRGR